MSAFLLDMQLELFLFAATLFYLFINKHLEQWLNQAVNIWSEILAISTNLITIGVLFCTLAKIGPSYLRLAGYHSFEIYLLASALLLTLFYEGSLVYMAMAGFIFYKITQIGQPEMIHYLMLFCTALSSFNLKIKRGISSIIHREMSSLYLSLIGSFLIASSLYSFYHFENFYQFYLNKLPGEIWDPSVATSILLILILLTSLLCLGKLGRTTVLFTSIPTYLVLLFVFNHDPAIAVFIVGVQFGITVNPHLFMTFRESRLTQPHKAVAFGR